MVRDSDDLEDELKTNDILYSWLSGFTSRSSVLHEIILIFTQNDSADMQYTFISQKLDVKKRCPRRDPLYHRHKQECWIHGITQCGMQSPKIHYHITREEGVFSSP